MRYALIEPEWNVIQTISPTKPTGVPRVDDKRVLNGIFRILYSGTPRRDLPAAYGPYTTCYNRIVRWQRAGVWDRILVAISNVKNADVQMIDSSIMPVLEWFCGKLLVVCSRDENLNVEQTKGLGHFRLRFTVRYKIARLVEAQHPHWCVAAELLMIRRR